MLFKNPNQPTTKITLHLSLTPVGMHAFTLSVSQVLPSFNSVIDGENENRIG